MTTQTLDPSRVQEFANALVGHFVGGMVSYMVDLGSRTGLFDAAAQGPATVEELADRAGLRERYVREWLGALTTARVFTYDDTDCRYTLPPAHAVCLTDIAGNNMSPIAAFHTHVGEHLVAVAEAFRSGGGVPYEAYRPEFTDVMDGLSRRTFDGHLVEEMLPLAAGLSELLSRGARVADIGCGTGHSTVVLARAFPRSRFVGYDYADDVLARGRAEAAELGCTNVTFEVADAARWVPSEPFDAVVSFDAIHDQADPVAALAAIQRALAPGGTYLMLEPCAETGIVGNIGAPLAPLLYALSTLHCVPVSLAEGGVALGAMVGTQKLVELLTDAGFLDIEITSPAPGDPLGALLVCHTPPAM